MKQGIDADVASMTQAQKTMLRYQYVMNNAKLSMGDFAKTANTWANVVKTLKQQFQALGGTIGTVFINAFKPALIALRNFMQHVLDFAKTVADALGAIFGWTIEVSASGSTIDEDLGAAADSIGDIGSGAGNASDGLGSAADNAKKLAENLSVLPFDELNQLSKDSGGSGSGGSGGSGSGGSGGSGGGGGMSGNGASAALVRTDSVLEKITSDIKTLEELGKYISDSLVKAMKSINWSEIYSNARNFGTGLAQFLNGLITPELFGETAKLIARSINTAMYAINSFATEFDWENLGESLATGFNDFFKEFDAVTAGININLIAKGLLDAIYKALDTIEWDTVGEDIGTFFEKIDEKGITNALVKVLDRAWQGVGEAWKKSFDTAPVETVIITGIAAAKFTGLDKALVGAITGYMTKTIGIGAIATAIKTALFPNGLSLGSLALGLEGLTMTVNPVLIGMVGAELTDKMSEWLDQHFGEGVAEGIGNALLALTVGGGIGAMIGGPVGALIGAVGGLIFAEIVNPVMTQKLAKAFEQLFSDAAVTFSNVGNSFMIIHDQINIVLSKVRQSIDEWLLGLVQDHPFLATILGIREEDLKLAITAEITSQEDLRKDIDRRLEETGDITKAQDHTGGNTLIDAAAAIDRADNKLGYKPSIETTAKYNEAYNALNKDQRTISTWSKYGAAINALNKNQRTISTWSKYVWSMMGLSKKQRTVNAWARYAERIDALSKSQKTINVIARYSKTSNYATTKYTGGVYKNGRWHPIESFASGGSPYGGQIFRARENGNPELVGTLKGSTAVLNNNQIVSSVSDGVARAIAGIRFQMTGFRPPEIDVNGLQSVIEYAVVSALANNATERPIQNYVTVKMPNGEVLARAVDDGHRTLNYRSQAVAT